MSDNTRTGGRATPSFDARKPEWLTTAEAARLIGLSPNTLRDYRAKGRGPRYHKRGHAVFYHSSDLGALPRREAADV